MIIDAMNRCYYENTDVVSRDGLEFSGDLGDFRLKSLWVKGDVLVPYGTHLVVEGEIFHAVGRMQFLGGCDAETIYEGKTILDNIKLQEDVALRFPQLNAKDVGSIVF